MRKFKIKPIRGLESDDIAEENLKKKIPFSEKEKYKIDTPQGKRYIAVCPGCDNPIRIFGIGHIIKRKNEDGSVTIIRPYGKHYEHDTAIAKYNYRQYLGCPYKGNFRESNKDDIWEEPSPINIQIYYSIKENFDTAVYILSKSIGVWLSNTDAEMILKKYLLMKGYQHYTASYSNIPWMLLYVSDATISLWGKRIIPDSKLYEILSKEKDVVLKPYGKYRVVENNGNFFDGAIDFGIHKRNAIGDEEDFRETFELRYDHDGNTKVISKIVIDNDWYEKAVNSTKRIRNQKQLDIAERLMPDLEEKD